MIRRFGPFSVLAYGQGGAATTDVVTGAFAGGAFGVFQLGKTKWVLCGGYESLKGTTTAQGAIKFGFGRTM